MWIMLNDAFVSIVRKDCGPHELLVRARRPGDIEKVFGGRDVKVKTSLDSDYMYRATVSVDKVVAALENEVCRIDYDNFKNAVEDDALHTAYLKVWGAMAATQPLPPYSQKFQKGRRKNGVDTHKG